MIVKINNKTTLGFLQALLDRIRRDASTTQLIVLVYIAFKVGDIKDISWPWIAVGLILLVVYSYFNMTRMFKSELQFYYDNQPIKKDIELIKQRLGIVDFDKKND